MGTARVARRPESAGPGPGAGQSASRAGARAGPLASAARALVERIGDTPLLPLPSPSPTVRVLGKAEWMNPGGSVKDRAAWWIVRGGLERGHLPTRRLLDASSGNTAIAYAMLGAAAGFGVTLCLPANASRERFRTLEAYGAELVVTDPLEGTDGAIERARELEAAEPERFWYADQYGNDDNWRAHYEGTALELWRQTAGGITHFVAGLGTTGTLVGSGRRLRELDPGIRIVGVEPAEALHGLEGLKHLTTARVPPIWDPDVADERLAVETEDGRRHATRLAREAGLFVGPSAGAAYAGALRVAARLQHGVVATVLPDGGDRYLSEPWREER